MTQERITTLLTENRSYLPPEHGKSSAWISGTEEARFWKPMKQIINTVGLPMRN